MAQRLDLEQAALTGEPVTLADGVAVDRASDRSAVSVAAPGWWPTGRARAAGGN